MTRSFFVTRLPALARDAALHLRVHRREAATLLWAIFRCGSLFLCAHARASVPASDGMLVGEKRSEYVPFLPCKIRVRNEKK